MFDMMKMLGKMKDVQAKLKEAQEKLGFLIHTSESGAGLVKVTVNGKRQIIKLDIDQDLVKPNDKEILQDLIVAAINKALSEVDEKIQAELKKSTEGLLPNIPGFDMGNLPI